MQYLEQVKLDSFSAESWFKCVLPAPAPQQLFKHHPGSSGFSNSSAVPAALPCREAARLEVVQENERNRAALQGWETEDPRLCEKLTGGALPWPGSWVPRPQRPPLQGDEPSSHTGQAEQA